MPTSFGAPLGSPDKTAGTECGLVREEVVAPVEVIRVWSITMLVATLQFGQGPAASVD